VAFRVVLAGIVRTIYLGQAYGSNPDKSWLTFNVVAAGTAEGYVGIICACAPSLRSCFRNYFRDPTITESRSKRSHEYSLSNKSTPTKLAAMQKSLPALPTNRSSETDLATTKKSKHNENQDRSLPDSRFTNTNLVRGIQETQHNGPPSPAFGWLDMIEGSRWESDGAPSESFFLSDSDDEVLIEDERTTW
jgi:hypothetical protein